MRAPSGIFDGKVLIVAGADGQRQGTFPGHQIRTLDVIQRLVKRNVKSDNYSRTDLLMDTFPLGCYSASCQLLYLIFKARAVEYCSSKQLS